MNIPEKLAEAVARQDWQLVSDVHESLTGQALDLPEEMGIGPEVIDQLHSFVEGLKLGKTMPMKVGPDKYRETIPAVEDKSTTNMRHVKLEEKKKVKRKKKAAQNTTTIDENLSDPVVNEADLYEPERGGHIQAARGGKVKVDSTKTELITCEINEKEREQNKKEETPRQRRKPYKELKYKCYRCDRKQKSSVRLSAEEISNFMCDACGKGVIRRS